MFQIIVEKKLLTVSIISLFLLSIICQITIGVIYHKLIKETDNLSTTENRQLKQCKLKFQNCYYLNGNISNIAVFVDKFISRLEIGHLSLSSLKLISTQLIMLSVFMSGVGVCMAIIEGAILFYILPYYLLGLVGLYIYFSVAAVVNIQGRRETLKINLMDYLENHMLGRLRNNLSEYIEIKEETETKKHSGSIKSGIKAILKANSKFEEAPLKDKEEAAVMETKILKADSTNEEKIEKIREKELKTAIAAFTEEEIEELLKELIV